MLECLERLLLEQYMLRKGPILALLPADAQKLLDDLVVSPGPEALKKAIADKDLSKLIDDWAVYQSEVWQGELGLTVMDLVHG